MQMRNGFPAVRPVVYYQTIAGFGKAEFFGDFGCFEKQMAEQFVIVGRSFGDSRDVFLRNNQDMDGRFGVDVAEGEHKVVFVNDVGGDFAVDDLLEDRSCS